MIEGSVVGTLLRLILSLGMVLTLMVFLARYLSKRQNGGGSGIGASARRRKGLPLEVLTRQGLSRGSSLAVVRVSGQLLLLGVTESTVSVLRELDDIEEPAPEVVGEPATLSATAVASELVGSVVERLRQLTVRHG